MADPHKAHVCLFIGYDSERSIDQAIVVVEKQTQDPDGHYLTPDGKKKLLEDAAEAGVQNPHIIGSVEIPSAIAAEVREGNFYIG